MDKHGIEMMILSLSAPAMRAIPETAKADEIARRANDYLAEQVARRPSRFQAFAALPMQDPELAITELERCIKTLGFRGALVNGFSQISDHQAPVYYDVSQYWPFWEKVEQLDVPFYLHPRNPLPEDSRIYASHPWLLGPTWAFGQETAVHALRLIGSGLFDAYPRLQIVLGHLGEGLPYLHVAHRPSQWMGQGARQAQGQAQDPRLFQFEFPSDDVGQFPQPDPDRCRARNRCRSNPIFGRLAVRECRSRGRLVHEREHQRGRSDQGRQEQRRPAVQAQYAAGCGRPSQSSRGISGHTEQFRSGKRRDVMADHGIDVHEELASAKVSGFHVRLGLIMGLLTLFDGYDMFNPAYVIHYVAGPWGLQGG
jgi:hypothetical protein